MLIFDARTARALATIVLYGLVLAFIYLAWRTLLTFLFAILFAYLLEPVVARMQSRLKMGRGKAVSALYLLIFGGLAIFLFLVGPNMVQQANRLSALAPKLSARMASGELVQRIGRERGWSPRVQQRVQQFIASHQQDLAHWEQDLLGEVVQLAGNVVWIALIPIVAIFFLMSGGRFSAALLDQLARRRQRTFVANLLHDIHDVLANYIRGQIILTGLALVVYLAGFELMRLPYAVALGVLGGLLEFIPMLGPLLAYIIIFATAFFLDYRYMLVLAIFLGAWRLMQDYYNSPRIMGGQVQLAPLAVLFGVFAGAEMAGVIGVYLSIPAMATLRVLWVRWRSYEGSQQVIIPPQAPPPGIPPVAPAA
ncbi:MAG: AI-2E family transporter [Terriglobales bacterium]